MSVTYPQWQSTDYTLNCDDTEDWILSGTAEFDAAGRTGDCIRFYDSGSGNGAELSLDLPIIEQLSFWFLRTSDLGTTIYVRLTDVSSNYCYTTFSTISINVWQQYTVAAEDMVDADNVDFARINKIKIWTFTDAQFCVDDIVIGTKSIVTCNEEVLSEFDSGENWYYGGVGSYTFETTPRVSGTHSVLADAGNTLKRDLPTVLDLSFVTGFSIFVYASSTDNIYIAFESGDWPTSGGVYSSSTAQFVPGWNQLTWDKDAFGVTGNPSWSEINKIKVTPYDSVNLDYLTTSCNTWDSCAVQPHPRIEIAEYSTVTGSYQWHEFPVLWDAFPPLPLTNKVVNSSVGMTGKSQRIVTFVPRQWEFTIACDTRRRRSIIRRLFSDDNVVKFRVPDWDDTEYVAYIDSMAEEYRRGGNLSGMNFPVVLREKVV